MVHATNVEMRVPDACGDTRAEHSHDDHVFRRHKVFTRQNLDSWKVKVMVYVKEAGFAGATATGLEFLDSSQMLNAVVPGGQTGDRRRVCSHGLHPRANKGKPQFAKGHEFTAAHRQSFLAR
jgi:hypothetical protein